MSSNQQKVYQWLVAICELRGYGVADSLRNIAKLASSETLTAFIRLKPMERDEVLYNALIEVDGEKLF